MEGKLDEWMYREGMYEWIDGGIVGWMNVQMEGQLDGQMDAECIDSKIVRWMNGGREG